MKVLSSHTLALVLCLLVGGNGRPAFSLEDVVGRLPASSPLLARSPETTFQGNPDLYGLGIRLGVYSQLVSSLIGNHCICGPIDTLYNWVGWTVENTPSNSNRASSYSKNKKEEKKTSSIIVHQQSGIWSYYLRNGQTASFYGNASYRSRSCSLDDFSSRYNHANLSRQPPPRSYMEDFELSPVPNLELRSSNDSEWNPLYDEYRRISSESESSEREGLAEKALDFLHLRKKITKQKDGQWVYPVVDGKVQVFADCRITSRRSFSNDQDLVNAAQTVPFLPYIDSDPLQTPHESEPSIFNQRTPRLRDLFSSAPTSEKTQKSKIHVEEMQARRKALRSAQRQNKIPRWVNKQAVWAYQLKDGRTKIFPCNFRQILEGKRRRWSFDNAPAHFSAEDQRPRMFEPEENTGVFDKPLTLWGK